jgi:hypothetical protein
MQVLMRNIGVELDKPGRPLSETAKPVRCCRNFSKGLLIDVISNRKPSSLLSNGVQRYVLAALLGS